MALKNTHPSYDHLAPDWEQMTDCYEGERQIKVKGEKYLPVPGAHRIDGYPTVGTDGYNDYLNYIMRAVFPDYTRDAVSRLVGLMTKKPANIQLPKQLEAMRDRATVDGESLQMLLGKIFEAQLKKGRMGMLIDAPRGGGPTAVPYIATYEAETVINWNTAPAPEGGKRTVLVVLDESGKKMDENLEWSDEVKYRVVRVSPTGKYEWAIGGEGDVPSGMTFETPKMVGKELDGLPFVFVNTVDLVAEPDRPPLLGLSNICLTIYRGEADYRQSLFMQGQDTLVVIGAKQRTGPSANALNVGPGEASGSTRVGAGARIDVPIDGDAKYIGVSSSGLPEQRQAIENDREQADKAGASLLNFTDPNESSGIALETRTAANTASIIAVARTGSEALSRILKQCAVWVGANPDDVVVEPNTDFVDVTLAGGDLVAFVTAKTSGAPISWKTIHNIMRDKDITSLTFEEELEQITEEANLVELAPSGGRIDEPEPEEEESVAA
jgi:hypothetical protein